MTSTSLRISQFFKGKLAVQLDSGISSTIFHYTRMSGVMGILKNNEIWATQISCLNDKSEFVQAWELIVKNITNRQKDEDDKETRFCLDFLSQCSEDWMISPVYVCSFCKESGDTLSQWRAYGGNGAGFSIGFKKEHLSKIANENGYLLVPCVYNIDEKERQVDDTIDFILKYLKGSKLYDKAGIDPGKILDIKLDVARLFTIVSSIMKDHSFEDENEVRLIVYDIFDEDPQLKFREGLTTIIPYISIDLNAENSFAVESITIGPTLDSKLSSGTLGQYLTNLDLNLRSTVINKRYSYEEQLAKVGLKSGDIHIIIFRSEIPFKSSV